MTRASGEREVALVYLLAGGEARRVLLRASARALLARADFDRVASLLAGRRLLPLIGSRALETAPDLCPAEFRVAVGEAVTRARAHALAVETTIGSAARRLASAGIRTLPLKGPLLAADVHGDTGLRETNDADLLVRRADLQRAAEILQAAGHSRPRDAIRRNGLPDLHLTLGHPSLPAVELHWRVHWDEPAFSEWMLARAREGPDGLLHAQPDDLAASLLLYYARDGFHGVRMAADIAAWWDRHGEAMPARFLEGHARRYPGLAPALSAAARCAEQLTGVPARSWLGDAAARGRRVDLATRFADWTQEGDRDQLAANISLVGGLLAAPGSGGSFVRRELSLPHAGAATNALHAAKLCARFALGLWHVRGDRRWAEPPALSQGAPAG